MSFADDSKLSVTIDSEENAITLQNALEKLDVWQKENNMEFNVRKFNLLLENTVVRDLGVQMCPNLNYNEEISAKLRKGRVYS